MRWYSTWDGYQPSCRSTLVSRTLLGCNCRSALRGLRINTDLFAALDRPFEGHDAVGGGKQGIVLADADIQARVKLRAMLANQNVTRLDYLTAKALYTEAL